MYLASCIIAVVAAIATTTGAKAAIPSCLHKRYIATPHSMGEAQSSCKVAALWQIFSVSVDMSVTATIYQTVREEKQYKA